jgi:hypothetical protein
MSRGSTTQNHVVNEREVEEKNHVVEEQSDVISQTDAAAMRVSPRRRGVCTPADSANIGIELMCAHDESIAER